MVSFSSVQSRANFGYGKVATLLGNQYSWYRATSAGNPLAAGNLRGTINALFSPHPTLAFERPAQRGKLEWFAAFDATGTLADDYLVGTQGTFFIAGQAPQEPFTPPVCVLCNRILTFKRPPQQNGVGVLGYGGDVTAAETTLLTTWPVAVTQGTKGEKSDAGLPGDVRMPWVQILMPSLVAIGIEIRTSDVCYDDLGHKRIISNAELTLLGWRITAQYGGA